RKKLTKNEADFFRQVSDTIIRNHIPCLYTFHISPGVYQEAVNLGYIKKYPDGSERLSKILVREALYDMHIYHDATLANTDLKKFTYAHPDEPESMLIAFIEDMRQIEKTYQTGHYSKKTSDQQLMEFASHLDELAPEIKILLAPAWCEY